MNITVYCGSNSGLNPAFKDQTIQLGKWIAHNQHDLIYGGGNAGLMGVLADTVIDNGGNVYGYMVESLMNDEFAKHDITHLEIYKTMNERKKKLIEHADAFITLPGGVGSMEEFFDTLSWMRIEKNVKKMFVLNVDGFYDPLKVLIENFSSEKLIPHYEVDNIHFIDTVDHLNTYRFKKYNLKDVHFEN